jgi:hypothetical protein
VLLESFGHMPGADTAGTSLDSQNAAIFHGPDLLEVRIPHRTGFIIGVAYIVTEAGPFSTDITFSRHIMFPPIVC